MSGTIDHPFAQPREESRFNIFPADLEDDPNVFFHGTAADNLEPIIRDGFKAKLPSEMISFASNSGLALKYATSAWRQSPTDGCVIAVRVDDLTAKGINADEGFGIYIHGEKGPKPVVIRHCTVPAHFVFV